jgi:hypothetical protein
MNQRPLKWLGLVLALTLLACGGKKEATLVDSGEGTRSENGGPPTNADMWLQAVDSVPLDGEALTSTTVRVKLTQTGTGEPVSGEPVDFKVGEEADDETSLSAISAVTDEGGTATVDLRLGPTPGSITVTASHRDTMPLEIPVDVSEATTGAIRVNVHKPGNSPVELNPYRVTFLKNGQLTCDEYVGRTRLPEALAELHFDDPSQPVVQGGFSPDPKVTVVVEALGEGGLTLAAGCVDGVEPIIATTTVTDVQLELLPVQPSGNFDVEGTWDISEAVASQNGATGALVSVIEFMANPGESIYETLIEEIEDAAGFSLDLLLDVVGVRDIVIDYVNDQLFRYHEVETFSAISADLSTMLNQLDVKSNLSIAKTDREYRFQGTEEWTEITIHWTWQCEESSADDCGIHTIDLTENGEEAGAVSYQWEGHVDGYDNLVIESHQAQIETGRLQLYLLEQVILPALTGDNAHSIGEALQYWVDCGDLASRIIGGDPICDPATGLLCIDEPLVESACNAGLNEVGEWLEGPIRDQSGALDIELSGEAKLVDSDSDGIVNEIIEGDTEGVLAGGDEPVTVEWSAVRPEAEE